MNKYFLAENIAIQLTPVSTPFSDTNMLFSCDQSIVVAGEITKNNNATLASVVDDTIGSEHWITEKSDFFRFFHSGELHSLVLSVPLKSASFDVIVPNNPDGFFSIKLEDRKNIGFVVAPQTFRYFDPSRRKLYCFTANIIPDTIFSITADFSLMFDEKKMLAGWMLSRPLENITAALRGEKDPEAADEDTYQVFSDCFAIFNDTEVFAVGDDVEIIAKRLIEDMDLTKIARINGAIRREVFEKSIGDIKDRFLDT